MEGATQIDVTFDFRSDTPEGADPDSHSRTLRRYHKLLWSTPLGNFHEAQMPKKRRSVEMLSDNEIVAVIAKLRESRTSVRSRSEEAGTERWYSATYELFVTPPKESFEDFLRTVAFAYSWAQTIPSHAPTKEQFGKVRAAFAGDLENDRGRNRLILVLRESLGIAKDSKSSSMISKVGHFWRPHLVPLVDTRVRRALKSLDVAAPNEFLVFWRFAERVCKAAGSLGCPWSFRELDSVLFSYSHRRRD